MRAIKNTSRNFIRPVFLQLNAFTNFAKIVNARNLFQENMIDSTVEVLNYLKMDNFPKSQQSSVSSDKNRNLNNDWFCSICKLINFL